jgi:hypothetical protein
VAGWPAELRQFRNFPVTDGDDPAIMWWRSGQKVFLYFFKK